jgi:hypothetical protein
VSPALAAPGGGVLVLQPPLAANVAAGRHVLIYSPLED